MILWVLSGFVGAIMLYNCASMFIDEVDLSTITLASLILFIGAILLGVITLLSSIVMLIIVLIIKASEIVIWSKKDRKGEHNDLRIKARTDRYK